MASGQQIAVVDESGRANVSDSELYFDESGALMGAPSPAEIRLEPADTPARRAAMVALILTVTVGEVVTTEPAADPAPQP